MGGNALKIAKTRRYKAAEFTQLEQEIITILRDNGITSRPLAYYRNKPDFGDMDVLILAEDLTPFPSLKDWIQETFSPTEIFKNGNVYSFDYKELQIDFIITPHSRFETAYNFFAWNDLGNFIGKIANKLGLKYGFDGLHYIYRSEDDSRILGDIHLSNNPEKILEFLGFSYERWLEGFDTKEEIFDYIIQSEYFNIEPFRFNNLSALHKKRNLRRKMYHEFLEYYDKKTTAMFIHQYEFKNDKSEYFQMIEDEFPGFLNELRALRQKDFIRKEISEKFNGNLIMETIPNLRGKELGDMIRTFKARFTDWNSYVLYTDSRTILNNFRDHVDTMRGDY